MSDDSLFYAGLAGGRQDAIDEKNAALGEWQQHSANQEAKIRQLSKRLRHANLAAQEWQEQAVLKDAQMVVAGKAFKEAQGQGVVSYLGSEEEFQKRVQQEIPASKKAFGIKD